MNREIISIIEKNIGDHMEIVYESKETGKRMYKYAKYFMSYNEEKDTLYITEGKEDKIEDSPSSVNNSIITSFTVKTLYDMERIAIITKYEKINILIYKYQ